MELSIILRNCRLFQRRKLKLCPDYYMHTIDFKAPLPIPLNVTLSQLSSLLSQIPIHTQPILHIPPIPLQPTRLRPNSIRALLQRSIKALEIPSQHTNSQPKPRNRAQTYLRTPLTKPLPHLRQLLLANKPTSADLYNSTQHP
jgi:hypothetical protein